MINNISLQLINDAAQKECETAIAAFGWFHSDHEAFAVLQEEIEELIEATQKLNYKKTMGLLWQKIRANAEMDAEAREAIYDWAQECAREAVQVMAMVLKWEEN